MTPKKKPLFTSALVARVVFYHFFGSDHPFPGVGYGPESECPTYTDGCAFGCLIDPAIRESLDDANGPGGDYYQTIICLFEHHRPLLESALSPVFEMPPKGLYLETVAAIRTLQRVHDLHAEIIFKIEDRDAEIRAIDAFRTQLLAACLILSGSSEMFFLGDVALLPERYELPSWIGKPAEPWSVTV